MIYELCHKKKVVLSVNYEPETNKFSNIIDIYDEKHIPVGLNNFENYNLSAALQFWWESRIIPKNRSRYKDYLLEVNTLLSNSCGFNLSDQYWIRPQNEDIQWEKNNFYTNDFNEDIGKYISGIKSGPFLTMNSNTPDLFSNGEQDKRWVIENNIRKLLKYGRPPYYEQPFNEMLATEICRRLDFPHVQYSFIIKGKEDPVIYSSCPGFVDEKTEFVPAGLIQYVSKKEKSESAYNHLLKCCELLGMKNLDKIEEGLSQMVLLDYITANIDRHYGNFGFLRNADSLEWLGLAPNFDTGNAMFYEYPTSDLRKSSSLMDNVKCKSFASNQKKQLILFSNRIAKLNIDFSKLDGIDNYYENILSKNPKIDNERIALLKKMLLQRVENAQSTIYSSNNITKAFLEEISKNTQNDYLLRIKEALKKFQNKGNLEKAVVNNYIRTLNSKNPEELVTAIKNDISKNNAKKNFRNGDFGFER